MSEKKSGQDILTRACESAAMFMPEKIARMDRKKFVENLGWLLAQTRDGVTGCTLDDHDVVTVTYRGGGTRQINVEMDSYAAIVRDVSKKFQ